MEESVTLTCGPFAFESSVHLCSGGRSRLTTNVSTFVLKHTNEYTLGLKTLRSRQQKLLFKISWQIFSKKIKEHLMNHVDESIESER